MSRFPLALSAPRRVVPQTTHASAGPFYSIYEQDGAYVIELDLPGVDRSAIDLNVEGRVLTVKASREMHAPEDYSSLVSEFGNRDYRRSFELGEHIDTSAIGASYENGVLRIEMQRKEEAQVRQIAIK